MENIEYFKDLALIIVTAKVFGLVANKLKAPQVVGEIIAGLILGPSILGWVGQSEFLSRMAEIGVVLIMFGICKLFCQLLQNIIVHIAHPFIIPKKSLAVSHKAL